MSLLGALVWAATLLPLPSGMVLQPKPVSPGTYRAEYFVEVGHGEEDGSGSESMEVVLSLRSDLTARLRLEGHGAWFHGTSAGPGHKLMERTGVHDRFRGRWERSATGTEAALTSESEPSLGIVVRFELHHVQSSVPGTIALRVSKAYRSLPEGWVFLAPGAGVCVQSKREREEQAAAVRVGPVQRDGSGVVCSDD